MLCNIPEDVLKGYNTVIVDEDILYLQMLNNIMEVGRGDIEKLSNDPDSGYQDMALQMLKAEEGKYYKINNLLKFQPKYGLKSVRQNITDEDFDTDDGLEEKLYDNTGNVNDLYRAGAYVYNEGKYRYLYITDLPHVKYIILSAFKDRRVIEYPQVLCPYKGELIQYTYHSLGRGDLRNKQCIYDFINVNINTNKDIIKISFKSEENTHKLNTEDIHYGNAIGLNTYKGKDIAIIGTPYKNPIAYLLPCCYLYGAELVNRDKRPVWRRVEYEGNSFMLNSFRKKELQNFMMYSLESELEQCVGRARLLRCDCKVYLFSAFPCQQAKIIQEDYLADYLKEEPENVSGKDIYEKPVDEDQTWQQ